MRRKITDEEIAKFLAWKQRYETDPKISLRQIATDSGISFSTVRFKILEYGWKKAASDKENIEQIIETYRAEYCSDPEMSALDIAKELGVTLYTVRYYIRKNNWEFAAKSKHSARTIAIAREAKAKQRAERLGIPASVPKSPKIVEKEKEKTVKKKPIEEPTPTRVSSIFDLADSLK